MEMKQDGITVFCLPDGAYCDADDKMRNPMNLEECPIGYEECDGDCYFYRED